MLLSAASVAFGAIRNRLVKHLSSASGYDMEPIEIALLERLGLSPIPFRLAPNETNIAVA
jgi:hypothetical protein